MIFLSAFYLVKYMKIEDISFLSQFSQAEPTTRIAMKNHNNAMILIKGIFMFTIHVFFIIIIRTVLLFAVKKVNGSYIKLSIISIKSVVLNNCIQKSTAVSSENVPSKIFDKILNTSLTSISPKIFGNDKSFMLTYMTTLTQDVN